MILKYTLLLQVISLMYVAQGAEKLVVQELISTFTSSSVQWSSNAVTLCQTTDFTEFSNQSVMGFFGLGDTTSTKTFTNIPAHWSLSVRFDLILYQSLDLYQDYIYVKINGNTDSYEKFNAAGGYKTCIPSNYYGDELVLYYYNFTHSSSSITVTVQSLTNEPIISENYNQQNGEKMQIQSPTEEGSKQNEKDQQGKQVQPFQFQKILDFNSNKKVGKKRPRQKIQQQQSFQDKSEYATEQSPHFTSNSPSFVKSFRQLVPNQVYPHNPSNFTNSTNLVNPSQVTNQTSLANSAYSTNQKEQNKRKVQVKQPYIYKYQADTIMKFTLILAFTSFCSIGQFSSEISFQDYTIGIGQNFFQIYNSYFILSDCNFRYTCILLVFALTTIFKIFQGYNLEYLLWINICS
ncbi:hypothetical protein ABPG74_010861 [Tetrahymena malaccensis]